MPREVILPYNITTLTASSSTNCSPQGHNPSLRINDSYSPAKPGLAPLVDDPIGNHFTAKAQAKPTPKKASMRKIDHVVDIIELTSSSEDETLDNTSKPNNLAGRSHVATHPPSSASLLETLTNTRTPSPFKKKRVYIISSSSSENEDLPPNSSSPTRTSTPLAPVCGDSLQEGNRALSFPADIRSNNDGTIDYIPTPRKPRQLSPSKPLKDTDTLFPSMITSTSSERRRTLLEPDSAEPPRESLSWEVQEDEFGGVKLGPKIVQPSSRLSEEIARNSFAQPSSTPYTVSSTPLSVVAERETHTANNSPSKQPEDSPKKAGRTKKMPSAVAALHRLAIPYLKELDAKVFGGQLGASHFPDLEPAYTSPVKRRGRSQVGVIWGMGSKGEYDDGHGSYIELLWSNRMATTAGRTDYRRTPQHQVVIKIELGVKVVTTEERLKNTLAHEACHAAAWAIDKDFSQPHGTTFKKWASKVMKAFPGVEVTTKHDYEIEYKYSWKCANIHCGKIYKRHSKSINTELQGCHCGSTLVPQFAPSRTNAKKSNTSPTKKAASGNALPRDPILLNTPEKASFRREDKLAQENIRLDSGNEEDVTGRVAGIDNLASLLRATTIM